MNTFLDITAQIMKVAWLPAVIAMLVAIPAKPVLNMLPIPDEARQPLLRIIRIVGWIGTGLVLLAFVFLFVALNEASKGMTPSP